MISRRGFLGAVALGAGGAALGRWGWNEGFAQGGAKYNGAKLPIGMNLSGIADWEPGFPFRNLMWGARLWMTKDAALQDPKWNTEQIDKIPLDANGYPLELPFKVPGVDAPQVVFTIVPNVRPKGQYVLLYDGVGEIGQMMNTKVLDARPGRVLLEMQNQGGDSIEGFTIMRSQKGNHVRNMRLVALADEKADVITNPFHSEILDFCRPFHTLRFMDWAHTNASLEQEWSNRKKPTFYSMIGAGGDPDNTFGAGPTKSERLFSGGVAIEVMLQLANELQIDPWLCVPHRATDEYISEYAKLVKEKLDPRRKVYLEFSNEVWNWGFTQAQWMLRSPLAAQALEAKGIKAWKNDAKTEGENFPERIGALARRTFDGWERVWTGDDRKRLVRVVGVQHAWLDTAQRTAKYVAQNGGADALSPAGYIGPSDIEYDKWAKRGAALTADEVIADLGIAFERDAAKWTREQAKIANEHKWQYLVYEGGQHLQPKGQADLPYNPALGQAQSHEGMYELYARNLKLHQEIGCDLFCAFASIGKQGLRWGSWGHLARYGQPLAEAPKMRALLDANMPKTT